jgi:hypothetical protein
MMELAEFRKILHEFLCIFQLDINIKEGTHDTAKQSELMVI